MQIEIDDIKVRGAREHNLQNIDVDIPRYNLILFTGLSGSGKSSLAMSTVYAEGQRRYVESLSAYARQFLDQMEKPDVDMITGLSPAISIEQKTTSRNPRSTVGTITEILDYLRLLFARAGVPHSPTTGLPIKAQQISDMIDQISDLADGTRFILLSPVVSDRKGSFYNELKDLRRQGFQRVRIDGEMNILDSIPRLNKSQRHTIELVVDRLVMGDEIEDRLADSLRTALNHGNGSVIVETVNRVPPLVLRLSELYACPVSGFSIPEIEPRLFSFNAHMGSCPRCDGLGVEIFFDPKKIIPDENATIAKGAVLPWRLKMVDSSETKNAVINSFNINRRIPWKHLPAEFRQVVLYGTKEHTITYKFGDVAFKASYEGIIRQLEQRHSSSVSQTYQRKQGLLTSRQDCPDCNGYRLQPQALAVKLTGYHIGEVSEMTILEAYKWVNELPDHLTEKQNLIADSIIKELKERLGFLVSVGLDYLTLSRHAGSLSGGESQRIRLASQIGKGLTGVLYVLDEPSIGLHQRDNRRLLNTLNDLRDRGNTVIVVEHDEEAIREADHVIDFGPGAGVHGGQIVASGSPADIAANPASLTGLYLSGKRNIEIPASRRSGNGTSITVHGASANNLKDIDVSFPLGKFICVTGVSGSGKSSLTFNVLLENLSSDARLSSSFDDCLMISGIKNIKNIIHIDQRPIGKTPRSNPATYSKAFDPIREFYSKLPESRARGYLPGTFSFNVKGGRCEACSGDGMIKVSMHFLPDVYVKCDSCNGSRYNRQTLQIKHRDKTISDILNMTIVEAQELFSDIPAINTRLTTLNRAGLGYMKLGHPAPMLSGGEAQRVKLAKELSKRSTGKTLYLLDEPTTGLHFEDIKNLLSVLHEFVDQGNTVIVIEHNLDVIKTADWLIDLGPEGGDRGGEIVATGTPEQLATNPDSYTGRYLRDVLSAGQPGVSCNQASILDVVG